MSRRRVYLDANTLIYALESREPSGQLARRWLARIDSGELEGVTSEMSLAETIPHPLATGDSDLLASYLDLLVDRVGFRVVPVTRDVMLAAAELRASHGLSTPDAIHVATAIRPGCGVFLTEDDRIRTPSTMVALRLAAIEAGFLP